MSTDRIPVEDVLLAAEYAALDEAGGRHRGEGGLPALADWLAAQFGVEMSRDPDIVLGYAADSSNLPGRAQAVSRPSSLREAAVLFRACRAAAIPITVSGGKSNLTGSATPEGGVIVSTARLQGTSAEVRVDEPGRAVEAPVGMILEEMRNVVRARSGERLVYPVDPTSRADATVGGTIACNASGFVPGPRGATRDWVEAVELLLPDGRLIRARRGQYVSSGGCFQLDDSSGGEQAWPVPRYSRPAIKNAGGPFSSPEGVMDLVDLVVGSEGVFGLVTGCRLRLAERPGGSLDIFFSLPEEASALRLLERVRGHLDGDLGVLGALEYFGINCPRHMDHRELLFREGHAVGVYIQAPLHGRAAEDAAEEWLGVLADADCGVDAEHVVLLDSERNWTMFMEARHSLPANALEVVKQRGAFTIMTDTVVPPDRFAEFLSFTHGAIREAGLDYLAFGHLGDCHLHFTILPHRDQIDRAVRIYDAIVARSAELGGVYSGEHGTGKRKRKDFLRCYGASAVEDLRRCKAAVDPGFLMNRGNVIEG